MLPELCLLLQECNSAVSRQLKHLLQIDLQMLVGHDSAADECADIYIFITSFPSTLAASSARAAAGFADAVDAFAAAASKASTGLPPLAVDSTEMTAASDGPASPSPADDVRVYRRVRSWGCLCGAVYNDSDHICNRQNATSNLSAWQHA